MPALQTQQLPPGAGRDLSKTDPHFRCLLGAAVVQALTGLLLYPLGTGHTVWQLCGVVICLRGVQQGVGLFGGPQEPGLPADH